MEKIATRTHATDPLVRGLKSVILDTESWLKNSPTGESLKTAKEKLECTISQAKDEMLRYQEIVIEKATDAGRSTNDYVHENPWRSIALGTGIGLLLGVIIARK
jgi:ElaB/YqjD/DUF883 family membrane-anchored ribosome-binding protein